MEDQLPTSRESIPESDTQRRKHFLPIHTNAFDRVFIAVILWIAIHLLWMRFVEATIPLWVASIISLILGIYIIWRG
jgi:predicted small integral membrane protein